MNLRARFNQIPCADADMLAATHPQVVVGLYPGLAVQMRDAMFFRLELAEYRAFNRIVPFVADVDLLVMPDVFFPVALGMEVDLFCAFPVIDAQLVITLAAR